MTTKSSRNKNVNSHDSQGVFSTSSLPREDTAVLQTVLASMSDASSDEESFALDGPLSKHGKTWEYRMKDEQVVGPIFAVKNELLRGRFIIYFIYIGSIIFSRGIDGFETTHSIPKSERRPFSRFETPANNTLTRLSLQNSNSAGTLWNKMSIR